MASNTIPKRLYQCQQCDASYTRSDALKRHTSREHSNKSSSSQDFTCAQCKKSYTTSKNLGRHVCQGVPGNASRTLTRVGTFEDETARFPGDVDQPLGSVLHRAWDSIRSGLRTHRFVDILNCRLYRTDNDSTPDSPWEALERVWDRIDCGIKLNCSVGCILRHKNEGVYRYFHSSSNNAAIFSEAQTILSKAELERVFGKYEAVDIREDSIRRRPNTSWTLVAITNVTFYVYKLLDSARIGARVDLPVHIKNNRFVHSMLKCKKTGRHFNDNMCFFRCLLTKFSMQRDGSLVNNASWTQPSNKSIDESMRHWWRAHPFATIRDISSFNGITLDMLYDTEDLFDVAITVFELDSDKSSQVLWNSTRVKSHSLNLVHHHGHFALITDVEAFASSFACGKCSQVFTRRSSLKRHTCEVRDISRLVFSGGAFKEPQTIFDKLLFTAGIDVPQNLKSYPFRVTYDIECFLSPDNLPPPTEKIQFTSHHQLLSISVCSNVPGFDSPQCFVSSGEALGVVRQFTTYVLEIALKAKSLMKERFSEIYHQLEEISEEMQNKESSFPGVETTGETRTAFKFIRLKDELDVYLKTIPVVSFNGQRYDLQILKSDLVSELLRQDPCEDESQGMRFVIKKNSSMVCLESDHLRFIDITNFIAPGSSYASYLSAFGCTEEKGFFPYEWVDNLNKLETTSLPPRRSFFSSLTGKSISEEDYAYCQCVWERERMKTFRDFLIWYNNRDVVPFLEALEKQCQIYRNQGIDLLKSNVSLPGAAVRWMLRSCDKSEMVLSREEWERWKNDIVGQRESMGKRLEEKRPVFTVCKNFPDLYDMCKQNMVGGPSIVFHRYHEAGKTKLREREMGESAKTCKFIQGFDANALYVWCLGQEQPVGRPFVSHYSNGELTETSIPSCYGWSKSAHCWLEWVSCSEGVKIRHNNNGGEVPIGDKRYYVDGFDPCSHTVYEFMGCFWHGHGCDLDNNSVNTDRNSRRKNTSEKIRYLLHLGFKVEIQWECEWKERQKNEINVKEFTKLFYKTHYPFRKKLHRQENVLEAVTDGSFFGFVECDIAVPPHLEEKFSEMNPIFKNTSVSRAELSPLMRNFAEEQGYMSQPQRMLIGSNNGSSILLHSELLRWYLTHGLVVSNISKTIQYSHCPVYKDFVEQVTSARRRGDSDPTMALLASTYKLAGNSVYGKTITNKERHQKVEYVEDVSGICSRIRSRYFVSLEEMESNVCEIISNKRKIKMDVPVIIGFSILQLAKLRMLQFYYDLVDKFIDRSDFQYVEMDTDSAYMALSGKLDHIIRPNLRAEFYRSYGDWFPRPFCSLHKNLFFDTSMKGFRWYPCDNCKVTLKSDGRTPGLFKEEFRGSGIVALNSKTYCCWQDEDEAPQSKISCKGLSKRTNILSPSSYKDVLDSKLPYIGTNTGFIQKKGHTYTYQQGKTGLSFFYAKRFVCEDGVSTIPISL